jgi:hypothetical protein
MRLPASVLSLAFASAVALAPACSSSPPVPASQAVARFDLASPMANDTFFDFPYPSDLRLRPDGAPALDGYPNPDGLGIVDGFKQIAVQRKGFPVLPVAYFRFDAPIKAPSLDAVVPAEAASSLLLVDVDPKSPERGKLFPVVATVPPHDSDPYVPANLLAMAARPGFVLSPKRTYAFVVRRSLGDDKGAPLAVPAAMKDLAEGRAPAGARGEDARKLYAPLFETLKTLNVAAADVAAATVFTTGDVVEDTFELTKAMLAKYKVELRDLTLLPNNDQIHDRFCRIGAKVTYPQFQKGTPPFDTEGLFELGPDGLPTKQRDEDSPVTITLPKAAMPVGGFPLVVYFHGSGGRSSQHADGDDYMDPANQPLSTWPAYHLSPHGFAVAGSAMPVSPDRLPGAEDIAYLNLNNPKAMRDTFRQGMIESRLFIEALRTLTIPPAVVAGCAGISLPGGETAYHFAEQRLHAQGQSMGGMYTNMLGAIEPRVEAVVPTGAGGFWTYFILETKLIPGAAGLLAVVIGTREKLTFVHPTLHLVETGWEAIDPIVAVPRLARRPLPGHPVRPIYEAAGKDDSYFPTTIYDAMALAYGHVQAGQEVWPTMQPALALAGLSGMKPYPLSDNLTSETGAKYTGAVMQYAPPPGKDGHGIYKWLPEVQYQFGCFHASHAATGKAIIAPPMPLGSPCP